MSPAERNIREAIDQFAEDLIAIAGATIRGQVERAIAAWREQNEKAVLIERQRAEQERKRIEDERLRRKQEREQLRAELTEQRKKSREERRASREARRAEAAQKRVVRESRQVTAPGSPPPLFVHKRRRDGQIQPLTRGENGAAEASA